MSQTTVFVIATRPYPEKVVGEIHMALNDAIIECDKINESYETGTYHVYMGQLQLNKNPIHHGRKARDGRQESGRESAGPDGSAGRGDGNETAGEEG